MMPNKTINWLHCLRVARLYLGISPGQFWQLTPIEFLAMLEPYNDGMAEITKDELEALRNQFPDQKSRAEPL